jgi:hypothetical protein
MAGKRTTAKGLKGEVARKKRSAARGKARPRGVRAAPDAGNTPGALTRADPRSLNRATDKIVEANSRAEPGRAKKVRMHQSAVAPRVEPSKRGAKQWVGGRRDKRRYR